MVRGKIPDRWEEYIALGTVVKGTRFIPFKVPLQEGLCMKLPAEIEHFTPGNLVEKLASKDLKLGLVIDLTNTKRYYQPQELENHGIRYKKIFTEGHMVPSQRVRDEFFETVDYFLRENDNNDLIGVHCTHGLNRTGYLICKYMIEKLKMDPVETIKAFNEARGYDIERENYLDDLMGRASANGKDAVSKHRWHKRKPKSEASVQPLHALILKDSSPVTCHDSTKSESQLSSNAHVSSNLATQSVSNASTGSKKKKRKKANTANIVTSQDSTKSATQLLSNSVDHSKFALQSVSKTGSEFEPQPASNASDGSRKKKRKRNRHHRDDVLSNPLGTSHDDSFSLDNLLSTIHTVVFQHRPDDSTVYEVVHQRCPHVDPRTLDSFVRFCQYARTTGHLEAQAYLPPQDLTSFVLDTTGTREPDLSRNLPHGLDTGYPLDSTDVTWLGDGMPLKDAIPFVDVVPVSDEVPFVDMNPLPLEDRLPQVCVSDNPSIATVPSNPEVSQNISGIFFSQDDEYLHGSANVFPLGDVVSMGGVNTVGDVIPVGEVAPIGDDVQSGDDGLPSGDKISEDVSVDISSPVSASLRQNLIADVDDTTKSVIFDSLPTLAPTQSST